MTSTSTRTKTRSVGSPPNADTIAADTRRRLASWLARLDPLDPSSELSVLNRARDRRVWVSEPLFRFVAAACEAAERTGGLVDPTVPARCGIGVPIALAESLRVAPARRPARPSPAALWRGIELDRWSRSIVRPLGVALGGDAVATGLAVDDAADALGDCESYTLGYRSALRVRGADRPVRIDDPFERGALYEFDVSAAALVTRGIGRSGWLDDEGRPLHRLIDPATGEPAFTGVVQVTALAPTALDAAVRAEATLLAGPYGAREWLVHGGVVVFDDGWHEVIEPRGVGAR